jgi:hypothetical protein
MMAAQHEIFQPKEGGEKWAARLDAANEHSGFDLVLFLDRENPTEDSGWMLELTVGADGKIGGQITAHPGFDALAVFDCTQDTLRISDSHAGPEYVITDNPEAESHAVLGADVAWVANEISYVDHDDPHIETRVFRERSDAVNQLHSWGVSFYSGTDDPEADAKASGSWEQIDALPPTGGRVMLGGDHFVELFRAKVQ